MANVAILSDVVQQLKMLRSHRSSIDTSIAGLLAARFVCECGKKTPLIRQMVSASNLAALDEMPDQLTAKPQGA